MRSQLRCSRGAQRKCKGDANVHMLLPSTFRAGFVSLWVGNFQKGNNLVFINP